MGKEEKTDGMRATGGGGGCKVIKPVSRLVMIVCPASKTVFGDC